MERGQPKIEHMLGVVTLGAISTPECEKNTILDHNHEFWNDYYKPVNTSNGVRSEIRTAMESLKEDEIFRITEPHGPDAGILYVEVEDISDSGSNITAPCADCGTTIETTADMTLSDGQYSLVFEIDCPACGFSAVTENDFITNERL